MTKAREFLTTVLRSGLYDRDQLQIALSKLPRAQLSDPKGVAKYLVKTGWLSVFQARKLLQGRSFGLVIGPYQVLAPLGSGGMSRVYLARADRPERLVALKVLPPRRARREPRYVERFRREMELSRAADHPHLAAIYEAGVWEGVWYIAMEFVPGISLRRLVYFQGPLSVPHAARIFGQVASGLAALHQQNLIHRDIKPSNILISPRGQAKLLDLGLALRRGELAGAPQVVGGSGYVVGSMDYLAPEQAEDPLGVDPRADVYGLGCSLYYAITRSVPFPGGCNRDKIWCHRTQEPVPIRDLNPTIAAEFAAVVRRMMAKRPEDRFESAEAVEHEMQRWSGSPQTPPEFVVERA